MDRNRTHPIVSLQVDVHLERGAAEPLCEQLRAQLASAIGEGTLAPGTRLPSTRDVAAALEVNRSTAVEAYRRLERDGLVEQRLGSGTYVRARASLLDGSHAGAPSQAVAELERTAVRWLDPGSAPPEQEGIDLAGISPDERSLPAREFGACLQRVLDRRGGEALGYGPAAGDPELREVLAERLRGRGLPAEPSRLLVVGGAQQGLDLVFRAALDPGGLVVTASPTYHFCLDLLRFHRAEVSGVPLLPAVEAGASRFDREALRRAFAARRARLAYCMPSLQNPTGLTLDRESRVALAEEAAAADVPLVEDDYQADLWAEGDAPRPLAGLPEAGEVVHVGTLSKALFPGLRVGWIFAPPALLERLALVKRLSDLSGSVLLQAAAAEYLASGEYDRHVATARREARRRMRELVAALRGDLPEGCVVTEPRGGHVAWVSLPAGLTGRAVTERALAAGVRVTPGETFLPVPGGPSGVRLSVARADRKDVRRGAGLLAGVIRELAEERRRPGRSISDSLEAPASP